MLLNHTINSGKKPGSDTGYFSFEVSMKRRAIGVSCLKEKLDSIEIFFVRGIFSGNLCQTIADQYHNRKDHTMEDNDAYIQKLHARLNEWNAEIDKLKAKADKTAAESRIEFQTQLEKVQQKRTEAEKKLSEVREAGEGAWEDLKSGVQGAWDGMEQALKSARSRFK